MSWNVSSSDLLSPSARKALKDGEISLLELGSLSSSSDEDENFGDSFHSTPTTSESECNSTFMRTKFDEEHQTFGKNERYKYDQIVANFPTQVEGYDSRSHQGGYLHLSMSGKDGVPSSRKGFSPESGSLAFEANLGPPPAIPEAIYLPERLLELSIPRSIPKVKIKPNQQPSKDKTPEDHFDAPCGFNGSAPRKLTYPNPKASLRNSDIYAVSPQRGSRRKGKQKTGPGKVLQNSENSCHQGNPVLPELPPTPPQRSLKSPESYSAKNEENIQLNGNASTRSIGTQYQDEDFGEEGQLQLEKELHESDLEALERLKQLKSIFLEGNLICEIQHLESSLTQLSIPESLYNDSLSKVTGQIANVVQTLQKTVESLNSINT